MRYRTRSGGIARLEWVGSWIGTLATLERQGRFIARASVVEHEKPCLRTSCLIAAPGNFGDGTLSFYRWAELRLRPVQPWNESA